MRPVPQGLVAQEGGEELLTGLLQGIKFSAETPSAPTLGAGLRKG